MRKKHSTLYYIKVLYLNLGFVILRSKRKRKEVTDLKTDNLPQEVQPTQKNI